MINDVHCSLNESKYEKCEVSNKTELQIQEVSGFMDTFCNPVLWVQDAFRYKDTAGKTLNELSVVLYTKWYEPSFSSHSLWIKLNRTEPWWKLSQRSHWTHVSMVSKCFIWDVVIICILENWTRAEVKHESRPNLGQSQVWVTIKTKGGQDRDRDQNGQQTVQVPL